MEADSVRLDGLIRYRPARLLFLFLRILILATFVVSRPFVFTVAAIFMLRDPGERLENTSRSFVSSKTNSLKSREDHFILCLILF